MAGKRKSGRRKKAAVAAEEVLVEPRKPKKFTVRCLGWCDRTLVTTDPVRVRFCHHCRAKRDAAPGMAVAALGRSGRRSSSVDH